MLRLDGKLQFRLAKLGGEVVTPEALPPDLLFGPSRRPPSERVSSVFDSACISATSYEKLREDKWAERSQDSLRNPTKAMLDIMKKKQKVFKNDCKYYILFYLFRPKQKKLPKKGRSNIDCQ